MKIDIQEIPYSEFKPNSLVVIRANPFCMDRYDTFKSIEEGFFNFNSSIKVLILSNDMTLETVPESIMNRAGWFRKTSDS